ncbi:hypothetical protein SCLARK_001834 [Spiroplasma clarkii]|uniref:hypothetical protein n=1 Tax=Spiroplasma clarkii TaxID=2139 RepID=UPI000B58290D|nr:hypothetical protein [Spiroplasma clarkii]ARU92277.1 hypothetical protein SCLARK_001834 [Spiroplasma clarkii]
MAELNEYIKVQNQKRKEALVSARKKLELLKLNANNNLPKVKTLLIKTKQKKYYLIK